MQFAVVAANTAIAASFGAVVAMFVMMRKTGKPDPGMMVNGMLAGLVAITAPCAFTSPAWSAVIGGIAGVLVIYAAEFIERVLKVDDPVGAISVHLVCGIWGTLAVGLLSVNPEHTVVNQLLGVVAYATFTTISSFIIFSLIRATVGLRVDAEEELEGLDAGEHAMHAYDFLASIGKTPLGSRDTGTLHGGRMGPSPAE